MTDEAGTPGSTPGSTLRIASYNVHGYLWTGERRARRAVRSVIEEIGADVLALQEVHPPPSLPGVWTDSAGVAYHVVYGPTLTKARGEFGNAILSRHPFVRVRPIELSRTRREPRGALDVTIDANGRELRVICTHLGLRGLERARQTQELLDECGDLGDGLVALMGDVNEWRRDAAALRAIHARFGEAPCAATFPSRWPLFALDRIWARPASALLTVEAHVSALSRRASDHLPVVATLATAAAAPYVR